MSKLGHEQPENDNRAFPEGSLFAPYEASSSGQVEPSPADEASQTQPQPVTEVMAEHERRIAERAARFEELTDSNWPPGRIEEKLRIEFPDLKLAEEIEREEIAPIATRLHARRLHQSKQKTRRRGIGLAGLNEDGPPPGIPDARRHQS